MNLLTDKPAWINEDVWKSLLDFYTAEVSARIKQDRFNRTVTCFADDIPDMERECTREWLTGDCEFLWKSPYMFIVSDRDSGISNKFQHDQERVCTCHNNEDDITWIIKFD